MTNYRITISRFRGPDSRGTTRAKATLRHNGRNASWPVYRDGHKRPGILDAMAELHLIFRSSDTAFEDYVENFAGGHMGKSTFLEWLTARLVRQRMETVLGLGPAEEFRVELEEFDSDMEKLARHLNDPTSEHTPI